MAMLMTYDEQRLSQGTQATLWVLFVCTVSMAFLKQARVVASWGSQQRLCLILMLLAVHFTVSTSLQEA
jgi:hypothetical protein